eukprot:IDg19667t1
MRQALRMLERHVQVQARAVGCFTLKFGDCAGYETDWTPVYWLSSCAFLPDHSRRKLAQCTKLAHCANFRKLQICLCRAFHAPTGRNARARYTAEITELSISAPERAFPACARTCARR